MLIIETLPLLRQQIRRLRMEGKRVALVPPWVTCTMAI